MLFDAWISALAPDEASAFAVSQMRSSASMSAPLETSTESVLHSPLMMMLAPLEASRANALEETPLASASAPEETSSPDSAGSVT